MASGALFSNNAVRGASKNLVELKAGRMNMKGKMVYPDTRKGLLYVYQSDDSLMHFGWKDRTSGQVEDDLIIFPDDCEFKAVPQCKTGRVYLLRFKLSNKKFFFWLQDVKADKDEENCRKINELLNHPPPPRSSSGTNDGDLQNLLNTMSQTQLMQLFGGIGQINLGQMLGMRERPHNTRASTGSTPTTTSATRPPAAQTPAPGTDSDSSRSSASGTPQNSVPMVDPSLAILDRLNAAQDEHTNSFDLQQHLWNFGTTPPGTDPANVQSGQAGPVVRQFGLGTDAINAAATGNLEDFVSALENETKPSSNTADDEKSKDKPTTDKKDDKDDGMALD